MSSVVSNFKARVSPTYFFFYGRSQMARFQTFLGLDEAVTNKTTSQASQTKLGTMHDSMAFDVLCFTSCMLLARRRRRQMLESHHVVPCACPKVQDPRVDHIFLPPCVFFPGALSVRSHVCPCWRRAQHSSALFYTACWYSSVTRALPSSHQWGNKKHSSQGPMQFQGCKNSKRLSLSLSLSLYWNKAVALYTALKQLRIIKPCTFGLSLNSQVYFQNVHLLVFIDPI